MLQNTDFKYNIHIDAQDKESKGGRYSKRRNKRGNANYYVNNTVKHHRVMFYNIMNSQKKRNSNRKTQTCK